MHPPHILPSVLIRLADSSLKGSKCPPWINYRSAMLLPHVALSSEISFGKSKIGRIEIIERRGRLSLQNRFCSNDWVHNQYVANDQKLDISLICGFDLETDIGPVAQDPSPPASGQMSAKKTSLPSFPFPSGCFSKSKSTDPESA